MILPQNVLGHKGTEILTEEGSSSGFFKPPPGSEKDSIDVFYDLFVERYSKALNGFFKDIGYDVSKTGVLTSEYFRIDMNRWKELYLINAAVTRGCDRSASRCSSERLNSALHMVHEPSTFGTIHVTRKGYNERTFYPVCQMKFGNVSFSDTIAFPLHQGNRKFVYPAPYWVDRYCYDSEDCSPCEDGKLCEALNDGSLYALIGLPILSFLLFSLAATCVPAFNWTDVTYKFIVQSFWK